jgi:hypothetical protein
MASYKELHVETTQDDLLPQPDSDIAMLYGFLDIGQRPLPGAGILIFSQPGSPKVAVSAAQNFILYEAPFVAVSGGQSASGIPAPEGFKDEAAYYAAILEEHGVPANKILVDSRANHTGHNVVYGMEAIHAAGYRPTRINLAALPISTPIAYSPA